MDAARQRAALRRIAASDPELAARLVLMSMPAAAAAVPGTLAWDLDVEGLGSRRIAVSNGRARVDAADRRDDAPDLRLAMDQRTLVDLASGASGPLRLMLRGRIRIRGARRKALRLRKLAEGGGPAEIVQAGGRLDPDVMYRALPYLIEPEWTRGHSFTIRYVIPGEGAWNVGVHDGEPLTVTTDAEVEATATITVAADAYQRLAAGEITPNQAIQRQLTKVDGNLYPVTLMGRWIDRAQGRDDDELKRERRQREVQERRAGMWSANGAGAGQGDPAQDGGGLLDYRQLYALWERQNWRAQDVDLSQDREHWLATPRVAQQDQLWSLGAFYVGEERVTADLAPFLLAAPTGEIEMFLATQLVDEARHAVFFDRIGAEVWALDAEDLRARMREVESTQMSPFHDVFDDGLRDVANRLKAKPDDIDLFVEGVTTYHMVVEGFLAVTGQTLIREYMLEHGIYPGFCEGFGLVERDEHRHVAFGVRFLRDAIAEDARHRATVERVVLELAPRAAYAFVPPYVDDPTSFVSYGYDSKQIYGFAYRTLKRRMRVLGIDVPPPEELMPGPISEGTTTDFPAVSASEANGGAAAEPAPPSEAQAR